MVYTPGLVHLAVLDQLVLAGKLQFGYLQVQKGRPAFPELADVLQSRVRAGCWVQQTLWLC